MGPCHTEPITGVCAARSLHMRTLCLSRRADHLVLHPAQVEPIKQAAAQPFSRPARASSAPAPVPAPSPFQGMAHGAAEGPSIAPGIPDAAPTLSPPSPEAGGAGAGPASGSTQTGAAAAEAQTRTDPGGALAGGAAAGGAPMQTRAQLTPGEVAAASAGASPGSPQGSGFRPPAPAAPGASPSASPLPSPGARAPATVYHNPMLRPPPGRTVASGVPLNLNPTPNPNPALPLPPPTFREWPHAVLAPLDAVADGSATNGPAVAQACAPSQRTVAAWDAGVGAGAAGSLPAATPPMASATPGSYLERSSPAALVQPLISTTIPRTLESYWEPSAPGPALLLAARCVLLPIKATWSVLRRLRWRAPFPRPIRAGFDCTA